MTTSRAQCRFTNRLLGQLLHVSALARSIGMELEKAPGATRSGASRKVRWLPSTVLTVLVAAAIGAYIVDRSAYRTSVYERPGLRFTAEHCGRNVEVPKITGPRGVQIPSTPAEGIRSRAWRADGTLFLEAVLIESCGVPPRQGDYVIKGDTIYLSYEMAKLEGARALCNCPYRLTYEISGIPRADYQVDFPGTGWKIP
jgi:hypothetical protein